MLAHKTSSAVLAFALASGAAYAQTTHTVDQSGLGNFTTISAAIAFAASGDTIEILDNATYIERIDLGSKDLVIRGVGVNLPAIDPPNDGLPIPTCRIVQGQTDQTRIERIVFKNSEASAMEVRDSSPVISLCTFDTNTTGDLTQSVGVLADPATELAGGIAAFDSSPWITECRFRLNHGGSFSGGHIKIVGNREGESTLIERSSFLFGFSDERGGGIFFGGNISATVRDCSFSGLNIVNASSLFGITDPVGGAGIAAVDTGVSPLVITNNFFNSQSTDSSGGALLLHNAEATTSGNVFQNCSAEVGGAIAVQVGSLDSAFDTFQSNVGDLGGAVSARYLSTAFIEDAQFVNNRCFARDSAVGRGGAIYAERSDLRVQDSIFENCRVIYATNATSPMAAQGGAIALWNPGKSAGGLATIRRSTFVDCAAEDSGGAIFARRQSGFSSPQVIIKTSEFRTDVGPAVTPDDGGAITTIGVSPSILRNTIVDHEASDRGGAICVQNAGSGHSVGNNWIFDCTAGQGAGIWISGDQGGLRSDTAARCSALDEDGAVIWIATPNVTLSNAIVWDPQQGVCVGGTNVPFVSFSCIDPLAPGNFTAGTAVISADPLFVDLAGGDLHLTQLSPCIDAGFSFGGTATTKDIDGQDRVMAQMPGATPEIDLGADEFSDYVGI